jgi:hypothetical protein
MVSDSKSDVRKHRGFKSLPLRQSLSLSVLVRGRDRGPPGGVTERPKVHDWKSCVLKGTEGSNPSPSAHRLSCVTFFMVPGDAKAVNPARPGREQR